MKLLRSELTTGFNHRLFDIPTASIVSDDLKFSRDILSCELTSEVAPDGFKIIGQLSFYFLETCDRCLVEFEDPRKSKFELWLTSNAELINDSNADIIWFPDTMDMIDLKPVLRDWAYLEEPLKNVCSEDCLGLCPQCGTNLNTNVCECKIITESGPWEVLKDLIS